MFSFISPNIGTLLEKMFNNEIKDWYHVREGKQSHATDYKKNHELVHVKNRKKHQYEEEQNFHSIINPILFCFSCTCLYALTMILKHNVHQYWKIDVCFSAVNKVSMYSSYFNRYLKRQFVGPELGGNLIVGRGCQPSCLPENFTQYLYWTPNCLEISNPLIICFVTDKELSPFLSWGPGIRKKLCKIL